MQALVILLTFTLAVALGALPSLVHAAIPTITAADIMAHFGAHPVDPGEFHRSLDGYYRIQGQLSIINENGLSPTQAFLRSLDRSALPSPYEAMAAKANGFQWEAAHGGQTLTRSQAMADAWEHFRLTYRHQ